MTINREVSSIRTIPVRPCEDPQSVSRSLLEQRQNVPLFASEEAMMRAKEQRVPELTVSEFIVLFDRLRDTRE